MRVGIGLPNPVPGCPGPLLPHWAVRAEERGFPYLATIDRVAFPSQDTMTTMAAAAAVTERIELVTNILVLPTRDPVLVAKEAATIASISGGRFTLGVGVGGREDDFTASATDYGTRGSRTDEMLDVMTRAWRGELVAGSPEPVTAPPPGGTVPLLVGGMVDASIRRTVEYGTGWTAGGVPPDQAAPFVTRVRDAWHEAGREGEPRMMALAYFSLGEEVEEASYAYLRRYYGYLGEWVEAVAGGALRSPEAVRGALQAYADAGIDDLVLDPTVADLSQVDRLADLVL